MVNRQFPHRRIRGMAALCAALVFAGAASVASAATAPNNPPDLGATPPDLSPSVDPNIIVTFDDSGSMASTYMGDGRPYDGNDTVAASWQGPWVCANVIDPRSTNPNSPLSKAMNGVYYNPYVAYTPPLKEDGSAFPNADATLKAVWVDGIAANRPLNSAGATGTVGYNDNPGGSANANDGSRTNLMGQYTKIPSVARSYGTSSTCVVGADPGSCQLYLAAGSGASSCPANVTCTSSGIPKKYSWPNTYTWTVTTYTTTDNRWMCGSASSGKTFNTRPIQNPFDGTVADPDTGATPNGGPVYWRFKAGSASLLAIDQTTGKLTTASQTALYTQSNWEAVSVPSSQYQNFANWYAYYRYRNVMARTAMSRVFGVIGTPTSSNIRVLWQNINNSTYGGGSTSLKGLNGKVITNLDDTATDPYGSTAGYRAAFFNWIFQVGASGSTPTRTAAIRAGNFLCNGMDAGKNTNCNPNAASAAQDTTNPYWQSLAQPLADGTKGQELACRQNFHMMMTDGLYNQPPISVTGNASNTTAGANLGPNIPGAGATPPLYNDATTYTTATGNNPTTIFNHDGWTSDSDTGSAYSDIAFYFWANNLRPDLSKRTAAKGGNDAVPQYFPDQTVGVTGSASAVVDALDPGKTDEVFWNPLNDPATWPHLVQFAVTLGAFGNLTYSDDLDCKKDDGFGNIGNNDACKLRKGAVNSSGKAGWPRPNGAGSGIAANIDDLWHAALNSRGGFFVATDPSSLVQHLTDIIQSVLARSQASTGETTSGSILPAQGTVNGFSGGYDSGSWTGYLYKYVLDSTTAVATSAEWDAGCTLTGGAFTAISPSSQKPPSGSCKIPATPPDVSTSRLIFTSTASGTSLTGVPFRYSSLSATDQAFMNLDPTTTDPNGATGIVTGTADGNGADRVDYLRGKRTYETAPTTAGTTPAQFRIRKSILGPIINSQAIYQAGPAGGFSDLYPSGSPEQVAAAPCTAGLTASGCNSYEKFVSDNINRKPVVYVGANDGMLHAFDASSDAANGGAELWAYVPHTLYGNGQLAQLTNTKSTLTTTVDDTPIIQDAFISTPNDSTAKWRSILVGSMRLGGRGVYALDITDQSAPGSESAAANKFMWEFTSANDSDLGYTYASANIARIRCGSGASVPTNCTSGGTWVVIVASGYYPQKLQVRSAANGENGTPDTAPGASANVTHLWVLNAATGKLIKKIDTTAGITSYGLSTPTVVDFGLDQIDDVAVAGDLAGNLWRFNLVDADPANWGVVNMFQAYANTNPCSTSNQQGIGCEPITVMPETFADTTTGSVIYVFGSGQYLGLTDRTADSVKGTNHFFGVRDYGSSSGNYPIKEANLVSQTLTQDSKNNRLITANPVPATKAGWMIPLNVTGVTGERVVVRATPLFSAGIAVLTSLIPGQDNNPCSPGRLGAVMAVNAGTGGPAVVPPGTTSGTAVVVGKLVNNPPAVGATVVISPIGGGSIIIPGVGDVGGGTNGSVTINGGLPVWRRTSWSELLNNL